MEIFNYVNYENLWHVHEFSMIRKGGRAFKIKMN